MAPEYTRCRDPQDYTGFPSLDVQMVAAAAGALLAPFSGGATLLISAMSAVSAAEEILRYILYGKLVCIDGQEDKCAVGHAYAFEVHHVQSPVTRGPEEFLDSLMESIDNDLSIDVILAPYSKEAFGTLPMPNLRMGPPSDADTKRRIEIFGAFWDDPTQYLVAPHPSLVPPNRVLSARQQDDMGPVWRDPANWNEKVQRWWWDRDPAWRRAIGRLKDPADQKEVGFPAQQYSIDVDKLPGATRKALLAAAWQDVVDYLYGYSDKVVQEAFGVPFLHVEIEGSRAYAMLRALEEIVSLGTSTFGGGGICEIEIFGIKVGKLFCAFMGAVLLPLLLAALAIAYAAATEGDQADALAPGSGVVTVGAAMVAMGRWTWDGGHQGWHELHPVKRLQLIPKYPNGDEQLGSWAPAINRENPEFAEDHAKARACIEATARKWCEMSGAVPGAPTFGPSGDVVHPQMTREQQAIYDAQLRPENRWTLHPLIDGCQAASDEPHIG